MIGPGSYPGDWTNFTVTVTGLSTAADGRFAFRYFVEDGGPEGNNSDYIGIDSLTVTNMPEPSSLALFGIVAAGMCWKRRRRIGRRI